MKLFDQIIEGLGDFQIQDVRIGLNWTAVKSKNLGLSLTFNEFRGISGHNIFIKDTGNLIGKSAKEIALYAKSWNFLEASIGVAAINSLIEPKGERINALNILKEFAPSKKVSIVGHFHGIETIRNVAKELWIFERDPQEGDLPDTASEYLIPLSDIVFITGSAFVNKTLERLLELSKGKFVFVVGPSTIMSKVLFDYGVNIIGGVKVEDEKTVINTISEGGHLKDFSKALSFLTLRV